jgi:hypothetical protein
MAIFIQLLLAVVITVLTFLVAFAGIQVFHILHEFRLTLQKLNRILDNTHTLSESAAKPITAVNEFFSDVRQLVGDTQDKIIESTEDKVITPKMEKTHRNFFHRSGSPLRPS